MSKRTIVCACASLLILSSTAIPAFAAKDQMSIEEIQKQLQALSSQVQNLSKVVKNQDKIIKQQKIELDAQKRVSKKDLEEVKKIASENGSNVKITMKPMPKIEAIDGKYSFQPFGRVHLDSTQFNDDKKDHANNSNFRRARLGFKGKLGKDFKYKSEVDFAEENVNFKEMSLTYTGLETTDIKIGNQKPSLGMEQSTSSNYIMFMERSAAINAFTRSEIIGIDTISSGDNWSLRAGIFNEDAGNDDTGEDEDVSFDVRGSINALGLYNPETNNVLHLGLGVSRRLPTGSVRFKAKPAGDGDSIVDTGSISSVDDVTIYGLEAAAIFGSVSFQSEYFKADLNRSNANKDASFDGYYAQGSWIITGEQRPYKKGYFGRVKPKNPLDIKGGNYGAWEILARYENLDLNDEDANITGGELNNISFGVNWYLTDHIRLMANVIDVNTDNKAVVADDDPTVYNFRTQWDF